MFSQRSLSASSIRMPRLREQLEEGAVGGGLLLRDEEQLLDLLERHLDRLALAPLSDRSVDARPEHGLKPPLFSAILRSNIWVRIPRIESRVFGASGRFESEPGPFFIAWLNSRTFCVVTVRDRRP